MNYFIINYSNYIYKYVNQLALKLQNDLIYYFMIILINRLSSFYYVLDRFALFGHLRMGQGIVLVNMRRGEKLSIILYS